MDRIVLCYPHMQALDRLALVYPHMQAMDRLALVYPHLTLRFIYLPFILIHRQWPLQP